MKNGLRIYKNTKHYSYHSICKKRAESKLSAHHFPLAKLLFLKQ